MLLGILSDTHDHADAMKAAIDVLREHHAEFFIHCGDVGGEAVIDQLAGLPAAFIWGNNDWDRKSLERYAQSLKISCHGAMADLELGGKKLAVIHGDDFALKARLLQDQQHDYLLQGHTHYRQDERVGKTRIINPGALYRAREKSVALLDTVTDKLRFLVVGI
jgi:putative phosphoesterase